MSDIKVKNWTATPTYLYVEIYGTTMKTSAHRMLNKEGHWSWYSSSTLSHENLINEQAEDIFDKIVFESTALKKFDQWYGLDFQGKPTLSQIEPELDHILDGK